MAFLIISPIPFRFVYLACDISVTRLKCEDYLYQITPPGDFCIQMIILHNLTIPYYAFWAGELDSFGGEMSERQK